MTGNNKSQVRKPKVFYGYIIVASTFIILVATIGMAFTFGIFLTPILAEFGWGSAVVSGAYSMAVLLSGFLGIGAGRLSDKFGPKRVVLICSIFFGLGFTLMSQVHTIWQLYLVYGVIIAIGMSAPIAPLQSTVVKWFVKRRGLMVAIFLMGLYGGNIIMPPVANWLILLYGWRTAYIILGPINFLIIFVAALFLKSDPTQIGQLPYGADEVKEYESEPQQLTGLSLWEAFRTVQFWLLCAFFLCLAFAMITTTAHIVPHAINLGISSTAAANILVVIGIASTAAMIPEGFMVDRLGIRRTTIILTVLLAVSMLWLWVAGETTWALLLFAVIFGIAFSSLDILLTLLSSNLFGLVALGTIIGFVNFMLQVGSALGPLMAGIIFDSTGSYYFAFLACVISSIIAIIIAFFLRPTQPSQH